MYWASKLTDQSPPLDDGVGEVEFTSFSDLVKLRDSVVGIMPSLLNLQNFLSPCTGNSLVELAMSGGGVTIN